MARWRLVSFPILIFVFTSIAGCEDFEDASDSARPGERDFRSGDVCSQSNLADGNCETYEAEKRTAASGCKVATNHAGFTGSSFIDFGGNGSWIEWNNVVASVEGEYTFTFRYANGGKSNRQAAVILGGKQSANVPFPPTGSWKNWRTATVKLGLRQGNNTIRIQANSGSGGPNLDNMTVEGEEDVVVVGGDMCAEADENKVAMLSCKSGEKIVSIDFASYGLPSGSCDTDFSLNGTCHASSSKSEVEAACLNKESCAISARNSVFGDPCSGKFKRLAVLFGCSGVDADLCPDDPFKTEPGECGCGVKEGTCNECTNTLLVHEKLLPGEHICSENGKNELGMTDGGELVIRTASKKLWSAGTYGISAHLVMQGDGNLVVYNPTKALWSSRTHSNPGANLKLENDGRAVIRLGSKELWSAGGDEDKDQCPDDPNKTEPGECGCGVKEGTCGGGEITHIGTTKIWDSDGQNINISRPSGTRAGDLLILVLHRTDDDLPLFVNGWTRVAECYKRDNGYDCSIEEDCTSWHNDDFCGSFGGHGGHDLAQSIFFKRAGSSEPSSYRFNLNRDSSGHPGWIILTALRGANTSDPVRDWSFKGCDGSADSVFPSVYGQKGDMVLLSQSFDDRIAQSKFGAPARTRTFGYVSNSDEAGFLFGGVLSSTGQTGTMKTQGDGGPSCKDALVSLTIKPQ